jgi:hypothetical protein
MKTETPCNQTGSCETGYAERPRYYPRQVITPDDLTLGLDYLLKLQRRHNRLLHGWGVVCGAQVCPVIPANGTGLPRPWKVIVKPGYILDPYGREIMIDCEICFDLRKRCTTGVTGESCGEKVDPWCSDVFIAPEQDRPFYVAVQYKQIQARPVRVQPAGCGCDDTQCEFSRWRDAYEICVLDECPASQHDPPQTDEVGHGHLLDCPECPAEPWVVLAEVKVNTEGEIEWIDNCSCRRLVVSYANPWRHCETLAVEAIEQSLNRGEAGQAIEFRGSRLDERMRLVLPAHVTETARELSTDESGVMVLKLTVDVGEQAPVGPRPVFLVFPDGSTRRGTIKIEAAASRDATGSPPRRSGLRRPRKNT